MEPHLHRNEVDGVEVKTRAYEAAEAAEAAGRAPDQHVVAVLDRTCKLLQNRA